MDTSSKTIIKRLIAEGWTLASSNGSHHKFRRGNQSLIVPHPKKDLPIGTWRSICKAAGWTQGNQ